MSLDAALQKIDRLFVRYDNHSPGCAVGIVKDGELIFKKGYGMANLEYTIPNTSKTVFCIASMSKQFTGMCIALLEEEGSLSLDDDIREYIPEFPYYGSPITIGNLVYHTSGIRDYLVLVHSVLGMVESDFLTEEELLDLLTHQKGLNCNPGEKWSYSNSNYFLLSIIVKRITGESLGEYAERAIFKPLGMKNTHFCENHSKIIRNRAVGYSVYQIRNCSSKLYNKKGSDAFYINTSTSELTGDDGVWSTVEDLLLWDQNFYNNQLGQKRQNLITRVITSGKLNDGSTTEYGFGLGLTEYKNRKYIGHYGSICGYSASMYRLQDEQFSLIYLSNTNTVGPLSYMHKIMDIFTDEKTQYSQRPVVSLHVPTSELLKKTGLYQNLETASIWRVYYDRKKLMVEENNSLIFGIVPVGKETFRATNPDLDVLCRFELKDGEISQVYVKRGTDELVFSPFLKEPLAPEQLKEYTGEYCCDELKTSFEIFTENEKLCMQNKNRHRCALNLLYEPTIQDHFMCYDPSVGLVIITFLRDNGKVRAFVFRDYDGDNREKLEFIKK